MSDAGPWIDVADADIVCVRRCLADDPILAVAAFHWQQAAEELVKALIVHVGRRPPRGSAGHNLVVVARLLPRSHPLAADADGFWSLTEWAIVFRYRNEDPVLSQPLPSGDELAAWLDRIVAFRAAVARHDGHG